MSRRATGLRAWILQRITALYLALYTLFLIGLFLLDPPESYDAWRTWFATPWTSVPLLLYALAILLHAWVGIRDVLIDYVHPLMLRLLLLTLFGLGLIGSGLWVMRVVFLASVMS